MLKSAILLEAAHGCAAVVAAVRKRDVFVGGAAFFAYFLSPPKESRFIIQNLIQTFGRRDNTESFDGVQTFGKGVSVFVAVNGRDNRLRAEHYGAILNSGVVFVLPVVIGARQVAHDKI